MNKKIMFLGLVAVAISSFLVFSLFGNQGWLALYKSHQQTRNLKMEVENSHQMIDSLKKEISRLKNDTAFIERIAREKLGMARRDEKIFKFVEESQ